MAVVSMKQLLESGVHFGHATRRWDPKMAPYIFTSRNGIHIIDLKITLKKTEEAYAALFDIVSNGGKVLFVGTKKQAQNAVRNEATRAGHYYVNQRWLGGTLTNFSTIRLRIRRLHELYKMEADGIFDKLPKKEVLQLVNERERLEKFLGGIKEMKKVPEAIFVVDPKKEINAVLEARKLKIPVFGMVDTNCDPNLVDYIIPSNDDAIRAVNLISGIMANAIVEAQGGHVEKVAEEDVRDTRRERPARTERPTTTRAPRTERPASAPRTERPATAAPRVAKAQPTPVAKPAPKVEPVAKEVVKPAPKVAAKVVTEKPVAKKVVTKEAEEETSDFSKLTVAQLKGIARDNDIVGYSTLRKAELVALIEENLK